jgi:hypothetical protein
VRQFWPVLREGLLPTALVRLGCNLVLLPRYGMLGACSVNLVSEVLALIGCFVVARRHLKNLMQQTDKT